MLPASPAKRFALFFLGMLGGLVVLDFVHGDASYEQRMATTGVGVAVLLLIDVVYRRRRSRAQTDDSSRK